MSVAAPSPQASLTYVSARAAVARTGWSYPRVLKSALLGLVRTEIAPGQDVRYCLEDLEAQASRGTDGPTAA